MYAIILAATGLLTVAFGIAVWRGRTELLAQYPHGDGSTELATRTGCALTAYGLFTVAVAVLTARTGGSTLLWTSWTLLSVLVAFGVAGLATAYT